MGTTVIKSLEPSLTTCSQDPARMTENMTVYLFFLKSDVGGLGEES